VLDGAQHFGFFLEVPSHERGSDQCSGNGEAGRPRLPWIEVPSSATAYLATEPGKPPEVLTTPPPTKALASVLETISYERQAHLVALPGDGVRRNGLPMPPVAILRVGDALRVDGEWVLHVSRFTRPHVGPPPAEFLGKPCSYCRIEFAPATITYVCPHCGAPFHCESEATASNKELGPLECARLMSECHHCRQPIAIEPRYEYVPQC